MGSLEGGTSDGLCCIPLGSVVVGITEDLTRIFPCNTSLSRP